VSAARNDRVASQPGPDCRISKFRSSVSGYASHSATEQPELRLAETGVSICMRSRIMTGLRFLFRVTLRRLDLAEEVYHIREPQKLIRCCQVPGAGVY
jgi:hypothetical protein